MSTIMPSGGSNGARKYCSLKAAIASVAYFSALAALPGVCFGDDIFERAFKPIERSQPEKKVDLKKPPLDAVWSGKDSIVDKYLPPTQDVPGESATGRGDRPLEGPDAFTPEPHVGFLIPATASGKVRFEALNLEVTTPGAPWVPMDPRNLNPAPSLMYIRSNPNIAIIVMGETVGIETTLNNKVLVEVLQAQVRSKLPAIAFTEQHEATCGGLKGIAYDATLADRQMYWAHWCTWCNGYDYQIVAFGEASHAQEIKEAAQKFRANLRQIDPARVAHLPGGQVAGKFESAAFGYRVDLSGMGWTRSQQLDDSIPGSDFAALTGNGVSIAVFGVPLPTKADPEIVSEAMMSSLKLNKASGDILRTSPRRVNGLSGQEIEALRVVNGEQTHLIVRTAADNECAYLMVVSWQLDTEDRRELGRRALDRVTLAESHVTNCGKLSLKQRHYAGLVLNKFGLLAIDHGDFVASLKYLSAALKYAPMDENIMENYLVALARLDRIDDALASVERFSKEVPNSQKMTVARAELLIKKGDFTAARQIYSQLFAEGHTDEVSLRHYTDLCIDAKAYDDAIAAMTAVMIRKPSLLVQRWLADMYGRKGDTTQSIAMFEDLEHRYPNDSGVAVDLAGAYARAEQYTKALEVTKRLLDSGKQDEVCFLAQGHVQLSMGQPAEAKKTLERAIELYPQSEAAHTLLKVASRQLGEGDNSSLKGKLEPVPIPAAVRKAMDLASTQPSTREQPSDVVEAYRVVGLEFQADKPMRRTTYHRMKVITPDGVARLSKITVKFDPLREQLYVNQLIVADDRGRTVATGSVNDYYILDDTTAGMAHNMKVLSIPVPGLKAGYTLEYEVTRQERIPSKEMLFEEIVLSTEYPVGVSAVFLKGDIENVTWKSNAPKLRQVGDVLYCIETDPPILRAEPNQQSLEKFTPMAWIGPKNATWSDEAHQYLDAIKDKLQLDASTRKAAAEATKDCRSKREKIAAIAAHVQKTCTYQGIEFGRRARVPNAAEKTLSLKYGDCKDHALLTKQLLEAAGIESYLTLVRSSGEVIEGLPSLDQFDHMVVFVPSAEIGANGLISGGILVDTTGKDADPLLVPNLGLANRRVLVLDPHEPRIIHTPKYPSDAGKVAMSRHVTFRVDDPANVDALIQEKVTFDPYLAPSVRAYLRHYEPQDRRDAIQRILSGDGQIRMKNVLISNLDQPEKPLVLDLEYIVLNSFHSIGTSTKSLVGNLPCRWETEYLQPQYLDSRETPFEITMSRSIQSSTQIELPTGYELQGIENWKGGGRSKFVTWNSRAWQTGRRISVEFSGQLIAGSHPAEAYREFCNDLSHSVSILKTPVTLEHNVAQAALRARTPQKRK